jgi:hypothetical protein
MSAKSDFSESVGNGKSGDDQLLRALRHGADVATAAGTPTPISDGHFGEGEDLIMVWMDDELLNALGGMSKDVDRVPVPFDVSAGRQLVELLLAWRVGSEPFCDRVQAMIWTSDRQRSAQDAHRDRGDGEQVGTCAAWTGREIFRTTPRRP